MSYNSIAMNLKKSALQKVRLSYIKLQHPSFRLRAKYIIAAYERVYKKVIKKK